MEYRSITLRHNLYHWLHFFPPVGENLSERVLVGCGTVEDGKKLRSERVIDFDHVDGSRDLPRVSGDDEGLSWPRSCHGVCGARVSERVFLGSLHNRRSFSAWQL